MAVFISYDTLTGSSARTPRSWTHLRESRPPVTRATGLGGIYHDLAVQAACSAALLGGVAALLDGVTLVGWRSYCSE